jgi:signal transduction histidine kinase
MATKTTQRNIYVNKQSQRTKSQRARRLTVEQRAELRKRYIADIPFWRHSIVGYIATLPLTIGAMEGTLFLQHMVKETQFHMVGVIPAVAVLLIATLWGVGPSLFAVLISTILLDYYYYTPQIFPFHWDKLQNLQADTLQNLIELLPFIISGIIIAIIAAQRERARMNALAAEQESQAYADELVETNQKLEDANQMKDRFMSIASHELKTPITTIRGQAQLALRRLSKQQAAGKELSADVDGLRISLERINDQAIRLTSLIDELLDVSSIRAGRVELHKRPCNLNDICKEAMEDQHLLTGRAITLNIPKDPVTVQVDCDRLSQVLANLVTNAVKYSPEGSPVEVGLSMNKQHARIYVRDRGKGISKDQQTRIFETFYRTPDALASNKQGMGLGLAISKEIIERHSGRIWVESKLNQGSTFFVELPLH